MGRYGYGGFPEYVPVAERRKQAARLVEKLKKKGQAVSPIVIEGRVIAKTFWGKQWCKNLESYSDYESRLPRGRTYVRNGSVIDLAIDSGKIKALVSGSSIYEVNIIIDPVALSQWFSLVQECTGKIDSLIELLKGKFSKGVMGIITHPKNGLFPHPKEIKLKCSCLDYANMCKHVAAVLYGVGARLDEQPESLFLLRQANHLDLLKNAEWTLSQPNTEQEFPTLDTDLASLFGIDLSDSPTPIPQKMRASPIHDKNFKNPKRKIEK